ncbi:MAG TPA: SDR family oxidoreductase [Steroidobacteraceae bacterium]|nr:SDR family oxidoreductase [Steroidobacteraceae bacterium]
MESRSVLVTGANRGLGLEFARQYAQAGWKTYAACRSPKSAKELKALQDQHADRITILSLDVTDAASVRSAAEKLRGEPIDLLLNNAGVGSPPAQKIGRLDYAAWSQVLDANVLGPARMIEAFVENVAKGRDKRIVTLTSRMGSIADNSSGGSYAYRSSKAGVNAVMKSFSIDLAPRGITCVVVHPGWVRTDMGGAGGKLAPAESVKSLRALIDGLSPAHSGKFFDVDGEVLPW